MKLVPIPEEKYDEYRLTLLFDCYKWDPQFLDHNTVAKYALVITQKEHQELKKLTESLDAETRAAEEFLNEHPELAKPLALPRSVKKEIAHMQNYEPEKHIRLMRYDFHPTTEGKWAVSEVNSDVPGGFAESTFMPQAAIELLQEPDYDFQNFAEILVEAFCKKVKKGGRIMLVHCTSYSDDRQVMQFLGDCLQRAGFQVIYGAADHLHFERQMAVSILDGNEGPVDAIFRFTPLEWLTEIKPKRWQGYFDTITVSCNHPVAMYAQTKRFPLVWKTLEQNGLCVDTWRELLPDTLEVKDAKGKEGYIYKPACGRVGEKISIKEACSKKEYSDILKEVKRHPKEYLAQKQFFGKPLIGKDGEEYHVCLGSYCVDGRHAGYYARISDLPRIDSNAADIPVLICRNGAEVPGGMSGELECKEASPVEYGGLNQPESSGTVTDSVVQAVILKFVTAPDSNPINRADKEIYKIWAPSGKKWVDWVRPVPFIEMENYEKGYHIPPITVSSITYLDESWRDAAILVDMPGAESVKEGLGLAKLGFRPIPIFNGTVEQTGARATVDNESATFALYRGAEILQQMELAEDARPAFLTDSNRMERYKMEISVFDNSWDVYHQDLPTAEYFLANGIRRIVIVSHHVSRDLAKIFRPFQKKGIEIYHTNGYDAPKKVTLRRLLREEK